MGGSDSANPLAEFLDDAGNLVLTVDGKERTLGPAELKAEIQKGLAGSARLEEAAKAHEDVQYASDVNAALEHDDAEAYFRLAEARGWNQEEAQTLLEHFEEPETDEIEEEDEDATQPTRVQYVERQQTPEEARTQEWSIQEQRKQVRTAIFEDVDAGLDNDPRFVKIMKAGGKRADEIRAVARNVVKRIVVSEGVEYSDTVRGQALDEVGHTLEVFTGASSQAALAPGMGPAPFSGAPEFVASSGGKTMERPDSGSPDYAEWVGQKFQQAQQESLEAGD